MKGFLLLATNMPYNNYDSDSDYNSGEEEDVVGALDFQRLSIAPRRAPAFGLHVVFVLDCSGEGQRRCAESGGLMQASWICLGLFSGSAISQHVGKSPDCKVALLCVCCQGL